MPSLADLLENYRNWKGRQDWQSGKEMQDYFGGDPVAQEQFDRLSGFGTADLGGLSGLAGAIKASHGSPHAFEKFDFSKIGTGEGNQSYGHGGYFAQGFDSPVAKEYRDKLTVGEHYVDKELIDTYNPKHFLAGALNKESGNIEATKDELSFLALRGGSASIKSVASDALSLLNAGERPVLEYVKPEGHLYNAELKWPDAAREASDPLGEHHLLDWDAPLSEQHKSLQEKIGADILFDPKMTGKQIYEEIARQNLLKRGEVSNHAKAASDFLGKSLGIPGIRYLDQGSRSAGEGTRNYVMFNDQFPEIVSRNGVSLSDLLRR